MAETKKVPTLAELVKEYGEERIARFAQRVITQQAKMTERHKKDRQLIKLAKAQGLDKMIGKTK